MRIFFTFSPKYCTDCQKTTILYSRWQIAIGSVG